MTTPTTLLFSYGTLQKRSIQMARFGRELAGRADALPGYTRRMLRVEDPKVVALTGESHPANAEPSLNPEDAVPGMVFEITEQELAAPDKYEQAASYRRILVALRFGDRAWVYIRSERGGGPRAGQSALRSTSSQPAGPPRLSRSREGLH